MTREEIIACAGRLYSAIMDVPEDFGDTAAAERYGVALGVLKFLDDMNVLVVGSGSTLFDRAGEIPVGASTPGGSAPSTPDAPQAGADNVIDSRFPGPSGPRDFT